MNVLALDVGSSSVKAAVVRRGRLHGSVARSAFGTTYSADRAEVNADAILRAIGSAIAQLGARVRKADVIALSAMAPSWVAMDHSGRAITPVVTHQDRRSVKEARELLSSIGKSAIMKIAGNLPFPGGISSTTWLWFNRNQRALMKRADLVGHLPTFIHRQLNGSRVVDPSHASFMGIYNTISQNGWNQRLCDEVGASEHQLPQLVESEGVAGMVSRAASERFGITHGTPMLVGCVDTNAAMMLTGAKSGHLLHLCGSTDVLAACSTKPRPHEKLLTRALGIGKCWLSVSTLAAAGSSLSWAKDQLFADLTIDRFFKMVEELSREKDLDTGEVSFDPYLAGERASIEQRRASLTGLTLASTRRQMLCAIIDALARTSAARLDLFRQSKMKLSGTVTVAGGVRGEIEKVLRRDWRGKWTIHREQEPALRGLAVLADDGE